MKPGQIARVRVNPTDCMAVVDVIKTAGVYVPGMSFSSAVSLALSSLLQTMKDHGIIPDRTGFEYGEIMSAFAQGRNGRKLEINKAIQELGSSIKVSGLSKPVEASAEIAPSTPTADVMEAGRQMTKLLQKRDDPTHEWSPQDEQEFQRLYTVVYPTG
jgi:hypothetical protein